MRSRAIEPPGRDRRNGTANVSIARTANADQRREVTEMDEERRAMERAAERERGLTRLDVVKAGAAGALLLGGGGLLRAGMPGAARDGARTLSGGVLHVGIARRRPDRQLRRGADQRAVGDDARPGLLRDAHLARREVQAAQLARRRDRRRTRRRRQWTAAAEAGARVPQRQDGDPGGRALLDGAAHQPEDRRDRGGAARPSSTSARRRSSTSARCSSR